MVKNQGLWPVDIFVENQNNTVAQKAVYSNVLLPLCGHLLVTY
jgi:hypothetical protein